MRKISRARRKSCCRNATACVRRHGGQPRRQLRGGSASRAAAGALRIGNTVGAAFTNRRMLGPAEAGLMTGAGLALLGFAAVIIAWPLIIALPLAAAGAVDGGVVPGPGERVAGGASQGCSLESRRWTGFTG